MRVMELHAPVKLVQRSKGRTATAAAAYRAAARIECERTGQVHDYTGKAGVEATMLVLPDAAPDWDRATLWNQSELREKHPRALTAREIEVAFPSEFSADQRREAGIKVAEMIRDRYSYAADIAWHAPSRRGDQRNHHAHILFTARPFENGAWAKRKQTALDDLQGKGAEEVIALREGVAGILNDIAARDGLQVYVEHLSFETRGLDREATQHMGPVASDMERKGKPSDIGDENRARQKRNESRQELEDAREAILAEAEGKARQRGPYELFYIDSQARRRRMLDALDAEYGAQERSARAELESLQLTRQQRNLFARLWSRVSGRERAEHRRLTSLADTLRGIAEERGRRQNAYERERDERLERLKAQERTRLQRGLEWAAHAPETPALSVTFEQALHPPLPDTQNDDDARARDLADRMKRRRGRHI